MPCHHHDYLWSDEYCVAGSKKICKPSKDLTKLENFARLLHERRDVLQLAPGDKNSSDDSTMSDQMLKKLQAVKSEAEMI
ncbi:MAG: hypothetical protein Q9183_005377, partial [Haloplaca sp. 2 TL-2023]